MDGRSKLLLFIKFDVPILISLMDSLDVNYGGSTGFGRAFRESLHHKWGVLDVEDAYQSVLKLDALGLVDAKRAVVHGGSAGGYTVLQIATTLPDAFAAGAPHYGISDMRKLDEILHKFEYHLCDRLMGGKWEECESVWRERSPIYHADKIKMPLLVCPLAFALVSAC